MNPSELGKFIADLRNDKKLTQEELADKLFIDKRKISRWECGTSVPEFDMLIKLSEILDVSLYELSICKKISPLSKKDRLINKFKSIKDFKRYQLKKKIIILLIILISIIFIISIIYFIKYHNTIEIYELISKEKDYYIEGNYIKTKDYNTFIINHVGSNNSKLTNCYYEIYDDTKRIYYTNNSTVYHDNINNLNINNLSVNLICTNNKKTVTNTFKIKLIKKYDNKLF